MNLESINMIDIALAGVSAVLLAVCILLLVRLVKRKKQCAMLQMELDINTSCFSPIVFKCPFSMTAILSVRRKTSSLS